GLRQADGDALIDCISPTRGWPHRIGETNSGKATSTPRHGGVEGSVTAAGYGLQRALGTRTGARDRAQSAPRLRTTDDAGAPHLRRASRPSSLSQSPDRSPETVRGVRPFRDDAFDVTLGARIERVGDGAAKFGDD